MQTLHVSGMRCPNCSAAVHKALTAIHGVENVQVDLATGTVSYSVQAGQQVDVEAVQTAIRDAGFEVA